jgi:hypothetical protein
MGDRLHPPGFSDLPTALRLHRILFRSKVEAALYTLQALRGAILGRTGKPPGLPGRRAAYLCLTAIQVMHSKILQIKKKTWACLESFHSGNLERLFIFRRNNPFSKKLETKF